jgi:hypothetical protein
MFILIFNFLIKVIRVIRVICEICGLKMSTRKALRFFCHGSFNLIQRVS